MAYNVRTRDGLTDRDQALGRQPPRTRNERTVIGKAERTRHRPPMDEESLTVAAEVTRSIVRDGRHVLAVARPVEPKGWLLTIVNDRHILCTWHEFFASAEQALKAAERAIDAEGIEAFTDGEGFEYLPSVGNFHRCN